MKIMKTLTLTSLVFTLAFGLTCCKKTAPDISGDWETCYFSINGKTENLVLSTVCIEQAKRDKRRYTFNGLSGVNTFQATFDSNDEGTLSLAGDVLSTKMSGPIEMLEFENRFLQAISASDSYSLSLDDSGKELLSLESTAEHSTLRFSKLSLRGSEFILIAMNQGGAVVSVNGDSIEENDKNYFLTFGEDGTIQAKTPLNIITANYILDEKHHTLSFNQNGGLATLRSGDVETMKDEEGFKSTLFETVSFIRAGRELDLYNKNGELLLMFYKKDKV